MPTPYDSLKPFSFSSIAFPYTSYTIVGGIREKTHEYPHSPGGAIEKLGRKLYEVDVSAEFLAGAIVPRYVALWPDGLSVLRTLYENQTVADLHVPTVGTFKAVCTSWKETARNTRRNGPSVEFQFKEDQNSALLVNKLIDIDRAALDVKLDDWTAAVAAMQEALTIDPATVDIFDGITAIANGVLSIKDQIDLYGSLVASKITTLALLCDQADRQLHELDTLEFQNVRDALHELWLSATTLQKDLQVKLATLRTFTTPINMSINAVARAVGIENPADVLQLNAIRDPLLIPAGTALRYYAQAA